MSCKYWQCVDRMWSGSIMQVTESGPWRKDQPESDIKVYIRYLKSLPCGLPLSLDAEPLLLQVRWSSIFLRCFPPEAFLEGKTVTQPSDLFCLQATASSPCHSQLFNIAHRKSEWHWRVGSGLGKRMKLRVVLFWVAQSYPYIKPPIWNRYISLHSLYNVAVFKAKATPILSDHKSLEDKGPLIF